MPSHARTNYHPHLREHKNARAPESALGQLVWRPRVWFESTFALSMLEDWEKVLLLTILSGLIILVATGFFQYLPQHIRLMRGRAAYYIFGSDKASFYATVWDGQLASWWASAEQALGMNGVGSEGRGVEL